MSSAFHIFFSSYVEIFRRIELHFSRPPLFSSSPCQPPDRSAEVRRALVAQVDVKLPHRITEHVIPEHHTEGFAVVGLNTAYFGRDDAGLVGPVVVGALRFDVDVVPFIEYKFMKKTKNILTFLSSSNRYNFYQ